MSVDGASASASVSVCGVSRFAISLDRDDGDGRESVRGGRKRETSPNFCNKTAKNHNIDC